MRRFWIGLLAVCMVLAMVPNMALANNSTQAKPKEVLYFSNPDQVGTQDVRYGTCGMSYIWLYDAGSLMAEVTMGAESSYGTMYRVDWRYDLYKYYNGTWTWVDARQGTDWLFSYQWSLPILHDVSMCVNAGPKVIHWRRLGIDPPRQKDYGSGV